ncbi:L-arabinitol 4-dehydrogenase [Lineolata rhizophorae]|uniref:L-arabinitol 4-dehydrogenase n=1 Tax=Lineolata rhizophorae TaxID=578093 RepID=A0A6A6P531_9PEZI|nr:L-arabinitol 4-dehydrogenase [Lineolata rhizophorae]
MAAALAQSRKDNIGIYTNPAHELWVSEAGPALEDVVAGRDLKEGEVYLELRCTGICGSDVHFWHDGSIGDLVVRSNHIMGYKSAGEVLAIHPSVKHLAVGDRVAVEPNIPCQKCEPCLLGRYNGCQNDIFLSSPPDNGLLRRYVKHPAMWRHKIADMSFEKGALLEPLAVALAGCQRAGLALGDPVLICGAGPIGLMNLLCAQAAGCSPLAITDLDTGRLVFAKKLVPRVRTFQVLKGKTPLECAADIIATMDGNKPRVAIECTGAESSVATAIYSVKFGGKVFKVGVGKPEMKIPFMRASTQELELVYQYRYSNMWPKAIRLVQNGVIDLDGLVTHRYNLSEGVQAFKTASDTKSGAMKVHVINDDSLEQSGRVSQPKVNKL